MLIIHILKRGSDPMYILKTVYQSGLPLLVNKDKPSSEIVNFSVY